MRPWWSGWGGISIMSGRVREWMREAETAAIPNLSWAAPQATVLHSKGQIQGALRTENWFYDPCLRPIMGPSSFDAAKFGIAAETALFPLV